MASLPIIRDDMLLFEDTSGRPQRGQIVPCLMCMKPFIMPMYVGTPDQLCPECWTTYDEAARVVCLHCQITVARLVPKLLDCGFLIRPRHVYHVDACNVCRRQIVSSNVIEITEWMRTTREPKIIIPFTTRKQK